MGLAALAERLLVELGWPARWPLKWPAGLLAAAFLVAVAWLASRIFVHLIARWLKHLASRTETDLDDRLLELASKPTRKLVVLGGLYLAIGELPLADGARRLATGIVFAVAVFVALRVVTQIILVLIGTYGHRFQERGDKLQFEKDYLPLLSKILGTVIAVVGLIMVLDFFGQDVTSLVAALGIGGFAISFAAKELLGNMLSGFAILADRPFRPGDRIKLATGEVGDVITIGTRSTRVKLLDQNMLIVPNSELVNSRLTNFSFPTHATTGSFDIGVAYGTDVEQAKELMLGVIRQQPELIDPAPSVSLARFGDHSLILSASFTISEFANAGTVQDRVRVKVYQLFQEAGIRIPFPTREIIQAPART
jgi:MscS family membrane protein